MKLSTNFTLEEMTRSQTAVRKNVLNAPNDEAIANLKRLCQVLEEIRALVGKPIVITSGYRGEELNKAIGGARNSQHKDGCAADFRITGYSPNEIIRMILTAGIKFDQLIREFDTPEGSGWVHISIPQSGKAWRMQCLIIDKQGARPYGEFEPLEPNNKPKPLTKSRTIAGATLAGGATVAQEVVQETQTQLAGILPYADSLKWLFLLLAIAGIGLTIWARIDDHKKGAR
jgi:hypothetical protein